MMSQAVNMFRVGPASRGCSTLFTEPNVRAFWCTFRHTSDVSADVEGLDNRFDNVEGIPSPQHSLEAIVAAVALLAALDAFRE